MSTRPNRAVQTNIQDCSKFASPIYLAAPTSKNWRTELNTSRGVCAVQFTQ